MCLFSVQLAPTGIISCLDSLFSGIIISRLVFSILFFVSSFSLFVILSSVLSKNRYGQGFRVPLPWTLSTLIS